MDRRVTTRRPAGTNLEKRRVVHVADVNVTGGNIRALHLCVAAQAEVGIVFDEHFLVDGTMRTVANGAPFAQRLMFKNERPGLGLMTLGAALILPRHRQPARRFEDVATVGIVAIHAIHVAFDDRVMMGQIEFRLNVEMALETRFRIFAGVNDELRRAAGTDVFAARAVAGFAPALARHRRVFKMQPRMGTGGKFPDDVRMAIGASMVADKVRARNFQRHHHRGRSRRTGNQEDHHAGGKPKQKRRCACSF